MAIFSKLFGKETLAEARDSRSSVNVEEVMKAALQREQERNFEAVIALLTPVINDRGVSADDKAQAYIMRGSSLADAGDMERGIADFTQAIHVALNPDKRAEALWQRAQAKIAAKGGNRRMGMDDLSEILRLQGVGVEQRAQALYSRGLAMQYCGNFKGACADYTSIIELPEISVNRRVKALLARAEAKTELIDETGEFEDYNAVLAIPDVPAEEKGRALFRRGYFLQWVTRDEKAAASDYNAALSVVGLSEKIRHAATHSLKRIGVDYSEATRVVDQMKAVVKAQHGGKLGSVSFVVSSGTTRVQKHAQALCSLLLRGLAATSAAREIGEELHAEGGIELMVSVCDTVATMGGQARLLETMWSGIGEWQG